MMNKTAQLLIVFAAACWGLLGLFTRHMAAIGFTFAEMSASRGLIVSVCLFVFFLLTDREKMKINPPDIWIFAVMGGVGIALYNVIYFRTMQMITLSASSALLYTSPFMVTVLSALIFKDKITTQKVAALLIAFTGCVLAVGLIRADGIAVGGDINVPGILFGLASALCFSQYTVFGKVALRKYNAYTATAYTFGMAGVSLVPFCDWRHLFMLIGESSHNAMYLFAFAFLMTLIPFVCYTKGLEKMEASRAMVILFVEPLTSTIAGRAVYGEALTPVKIVGIALIFLSLVVLNLKRTARK
ncbi:MAG: DMT family transporter [Clostridiales bacterium]|nr:DMT family transporter [Clostridiales bacterium]